MPFGLQWIHMEALRVWELKADRAHQYMYVVPKLNFDPLCTRPSIISRAPRHRKVLAQLMCKF